MIWAPRPWRPDTTSAARWAPRARRCTGPGIRNATRATSFSPRRARSSSFCAFPWAPCRRRRCGRTCGALRPSRGGQAGQPGHLLSSPTVPMRASSRSCARALRGPGPDSPCGWPAHGPPRGHHPLHHRPAPGPGPGRRGREPLYVVRLEPETHEVIVGPKEALARNLVRVKEVNWLGSAPIPEEGLPVEVKLRSTTPTAAARLFPAAGDSAELVLDDPQEGVSPGQAAVFYQDDRVLGGGWITAADLNIGSLGSAEIDGRARDHRHLRLCDRRCRHGGLCAGQPSFGGPGCLCAAARGRRQGRLHLDPYSGRLPLHHEQPAHRLVLHDRGGRGLERARPQLHPGQGAGRLFLGQRHDLHARPGAGL